MKLCKDCKHYTPTHDSIGRCAKGSTTSRSRVTGQQMVGQTWRANCVLSREECWPFDILMRDCGKRGRWWEPR